MRVAELNTKTRIVVVQLVCHHSFRPAGVECTCNAPHLRIVRISFILHSFCSTLRANKLTLLTRAGNATNAKPGDRMLFYSNCLAQTRLEIERFWSLLFYHTLHIVTIKQNNNANKKAYYGFVCAQLYCCVHCFS